MASKTSVANVTLLKLGFPRVSNIDTDTSTTALTIAGLWDSVRDSFIAAYPWNFAIRRANLAALAESPEWEWSTQFQLPPECLRLIEVKDVDDYSVEGGKLLCNETSVVYIKYLASVEDVSLWHPAFNQAFSTELALKANQRLTDDSGLTQILMQMLRDDIHVAMNVDAIENPDEYFEDDEWLVARL